MLHLTRDPYCQGQLMLASSVFPLYTVLLPSGDQNLAGLDCGPKQSSTIMIRETKTKLGEIRGFLVPVELNWSKRI